MQPSLPATPIAPIDYRLVAALSLLLSAWLIAIDPLINRDAIIYLRTADAYLQDGFIASQSLYGRPLISICFATIHQLTGLPLVSAGLLLNTLFYLVFNVSFVATVHTLGGDRRIQWFAAIVVLTHPILNDHRSSIMRDPAYWALLILAFRELLLYIRSPGLRHRLGWAACILLATLFRFEGLFFAALAPLTLFTTRGLAHKVRHCLRLLAPLLVGMAVVSVGILFYLPDHSGSGQLFPAIGGYIDNLQAFPDEFSRVSALTGWAVLRFSSAQDAPVAVLAGLGAVLLLNLCRAATWPYLLLLIWGLRDRVAARLRPDDNRLLLLHALIGLFYLTLFILINRFMLERYANQVVIFLLLYLPFTLNGLWNDAERRWKQAVVVLLLVGMSLDSLHNTDYQKAFIRDAARWLREETPKNSTLVSNDKYIAYFSGRSVDWEAAYELHFSLERMLKQRALWSRADYLAMRVRPRETADWQTFLEQHDLREVARFDGGRHGSIGIVHLQPQNRYPKSSRSAANTSATSTSDSGL